MKRLWLMVCLLLLLAACFSYYSHLHEKNEIKPPQEIQYLIPHTSPLCQGQTNTCWDFATLSLLESEVLRMTGQKFQFSPMWVAYHAFFEKIKNYQVQQGEAPLAGSGLSADVFLVIRKYGLVRYEDFPGRLDNEDEYNHRKLDEMIKKTVDQQLLHEKRPIEEVLLNVQNLLNENLGTPPSTIIVDGREITPLEFVQNVLKLNLTDYIQLTSFLSMPFYNFGELNLPDNWLHYDQYFNVPLDVFVGLIRHSLKNGFSLTIDMDLTEKGYQSDRSVATLAPKWLSPDSLTQEVREKLFVKKVTSDDHLQHLVGFASGATDAEMDWYYIKDTLRSSHRSPTKGYIYMREDYLKMKVLSYMVNKAALKGFIEDSVLTLVIK